MLVKEMIATLQKLNGEDEVVVHIKQKDIEGRRVVEVNHYKGVLELIAEYYLFDPVIVEDNGWNDVVTVEMGEFVGGNC